MEANIDNDKNEIKDTLTCFICTLKISEPLMCPYCKKLVCKKCIKKWFDDNHNNCPFCKVHSSLETMISLPFMEQFSLFFMNDINKRNEEEEKKKKNNLEDINKIIDEDEDENFKNNNNNNDDDDDFNIFKDNKKDKKNNINKNNINKLSNKEKGEMCPKHQNDVIEYYCLNCDTKHCSKCFLFFNEESKIHKDHKIISIEQKNKFNLDDLKEDINNLLKTIDKLKEYKTNIEMERKIIDKKEEFTKKVTDELKDFFNKKSMDKKCGLDKKNQIIKKQLDLLYKIKNNYIESFNNFIEREDQNGFKEYHQTIKNLKDINKYKYSYDLNRDFHPELQFFETDFIDVDINQYEEILGEIYFNIDGINKQLHFKLSGQAIDEVFINLQIELNLGEQKELYYGYLLFNNKKNIIGLNLDQKMVVENKILIIGNTIIKNSLSKILYEENKCKVKLILAHFSI